MTQTILKDAILSLKPPIWEDANTPLIEILRPWMLITGLRFEDAIHLSAYKLSTDLQKIWSRLRDTVDLFDEHQLQEAACRVLRTITVYGDPTGEKDAIMLPKLTLEWDGGHWVYVSDPKMRIRVSSDSYVEALKNVQAILGVEP